jgi:hypothetical protein
MEARTTGTTLTCGGPGTMTDALSTSELVAYLRSEVHDSGTYTVAKCECLAAAADRLEALQREVERLREALREVTQAWDVPEAVSAAYHALGE